MPPFNYKLASGNAATGGSRKLNPVTVSGASIRGLTSPKLDPNSARITRTPFDPGKIVIDTRLQSASNFAEVAAKSAFNFQEREAKVQADFAVTAFREDIRKGLYGHTDEQGNFYDGYLQTKGVASQGAYSTYQQSVESSMEKHLNSLDPLAKQNAMLRMASTRDTMLNQASLHRSKQMLVAEQEAQYSRIKDATRTVFHDAQAIHRVDKVTGHTGKEMFYQEFDNLEDADKAWAEVIANTTKKKYLEEGYGAASQFYEGVAKVELASNPQEYAQLAGSMAAWRQTAISDYNSGIAAEEKRQKKELETRQQNNSITLFTDVNSEQPKIRTKGQLNAMLQARQIDQKTYNSYMEKVYGEVDKRSDPEALRRHMDLLQNTAVKGFKTEDGTDVSFSFYNDIDISSSDATFLRSFQEKLSDPKYLNRYSRGKEQIDGWLKGEFWQSGIYARDKELQINTAYNELHSRLSSGEEYDSIIMDMKNRYSPVIQKFERLPIPRGMQIKPQTVEEVRAQALKVKQKYDNGGMTREVYYSQINILNDYMQTLTTVSESE